ncbi:hypothetical protein BPMI_01387 [Candidatus Burkholderia pumila]|uniref:Cupin type-1 domain-containing protein n=1 Tax=Candidatus Burkholderia pumila TaxID=1090375 RepID=A0ABR5HK19_9BURK|nr:hypothetical protein BPMI_01387 [Candidatus Burkholderia pumila]
MQGRKPKIPNGRDAQENTAAFALIQDDNEPIVVNGEPAGASICFVKTGATTGGRYLMAKVEVPPGSGLPLHAHTRTDEWFYFPEGGAVMLMGATKYKDADNPPDLAGRGTIRLVPMKKKGSLVFGPHNHVHGYLNVSDKTIQAWLVWTPDTPEVSLLGYFQSIAKPVLPGVRGALNNPIVQLKAVSEARKYGMMFSKDFWQYAEKVEDGPAPFGKNLPGLIRLL